MPQKEQGILYDHPSQEVLGKVMASTDVHVLIPRTSKYVTSYGKREFTEVIVKG